MSGSASKLLLPAIAVVAVVTLIAGALFEVLQRGPRPFWLKR